MSNSNSNTWSAAGLTQDELMIKDECIVVDNDDNIVGHSSKKESHVFSKETPRGKLHRAFSVFLFNEEGKLLLQQRAADKITFPNVWTNTCCSHPLYGCTPNEVDTTEDVRRGKVDGIRAAAVRKLQHELGIDSPKVTANKFKYLTRLHYWAADVVTHGAKSPWGEHEIDYILFIKADVPITLNPEEVQDTKYVTSEELKELMAPTSGLLWSPWFRIMAEKFLVHWWDDLNKTLTTDLYVDYKTIHRFDPTSEHMGGGGNAREWLGSSASPYGAKDLASTNSAAVRTGNTGLKQGGYGKVEIHKHSLLEQLSHPNEIVAALYVLFVDFMPNKVDRSAESFRFCDDMLGKVSRSFAAVIRQLPTALCTDIMIFYLVLRALDTIEDDMVTFKDKEMEKAKHLQTFYKTGLVTEGWTMDGVGEGDERALLEQFHHVVTVYKTLPEKSQEVIADITKRMGEGMASFVQKDLGQGTVEIKDYNLYCHYVAGLVGEGLSRLFYSTGYETEYVNDVATTLANSMGLFLQKTNIIRDYLEDYVDGRAWWPQEIWKLYATETKELGEFTEPEHRAQALACLNHMVTDALASVPDCIDYMDILRCEETFRFCAIPQAMAIATLAEVYNNPDVFTGVVKIRRGLAARLILDTDTPAGLQKWLKLMATTILNKIPPGDPNADKTADICDQIITLTSKKATVGLTYSYVYSIGITAPVLIPIALYYFLGPQFGPLGLHKPSFDVENTYFGVQLLFLVSFLVCTSFGFYYGRETLAKAEVYAKPAV